MRPYKHLNAAPLKPNKFWVKSSPQYKRQEKFKGIRAFAYVTPEGTTFITRGGKDCTRNFSHLARARGNCYVLDGELWQSGVEDEVIAGWANSKYLTDDTSGVCFQCFDILEAEGTTLTPLVLETRDGHRIEALDDINHPQFLCVPYLTGDPDEDFAMIVARGGEGQMFKNMKGEYPQRAGDNRPQGFWFKEKSVEEYDVVTMGYTLGKGKYEGMLGAICYGMYVDGKLKYLGNCSGLSDEHRERLTVELKDSDRIVFEVRAAGQDEKSGALIEPRFIRYREDKQPHECIWYR